MSLLEDRLRCVLLFRDAAEMEAWLKTKYAAIRELKRQYAPSEHVCWMNKDALQITIMRKED